MSALSEAGIPIEEVQIGKEFDFENTQTFQLYGAYPFSFENGLKAMKEHGKKIVYDMDDALTLVEENNPFYFEVKKDLNSIDQILGYADEVTVSTPKMAEYVKGLSPHSKVTILPNTYDPNHWPQIFTKREGIRIGFAGATPHLSDLINILPTIKILQDKYNIKFLIMGFGQSDYTTFYKHYRYIAGKEAEKELKQLDLLLSDIVFEWVPFVDFTIYPQVLNNLALDIGICPLRDTEFNRHRSAIKAMEYTLTGALALASDVENYRTEPTSILVKDNEWLETLEYWINNPELRKQKRNEYYEWIKENRDINKQVELLKSIYVV